MIRDIPDAHIINPRDVAAMRRAQGFPEPLPEKFQEQLLHTVAYDEEFRTALRRLLLEEVRL